MPRVLTSPPPGHRLDQNVDSSNMTAPGRLAYRNRKLGERMAMSAGRTAASIPMAGAAGAPPLHLSVWLQPMWVNYHWIAHKRVLMIHVIWLNDFHLAALSVLNSSAPVRPRIIQSLLPRRLRTLARISMICPALAVRVLYRSTCRRACLGGVPHLADFSGLRMETPRCICAVRRIPTKCPPS